MYTKKKVEKMRRCEDEKKNYDKKKFKMSADAKWKWSKKKAQKKFSDNRLFCIYMQEEKSVVLIVWVQKKKKIVSVRFHNKKKFFFGGSQNIFKFFNIVEFNCLIVKKKKVK